MSKKNNKLSFLHRCAGVSKYINDCPSSEKSKYEIIGSFVLVTALFAWGTCGYAIYTCSNDYVLAVIIGFLWATMIFNLDRFIVSSTPIYLDEESITSPSKDDSNPENSDEQNLLSGDFKISSLPFILRLIMGVVVGIIIANPLEIYFFRDKIEARIEENFAIDYKKSEPFKDYSKELEDIKDKILDSPKSLEDALDLMVVAKLPDNTNKLQSINERKEFDLSILTTRLKKAIENKDCQITPGCAYLKPIPGRIYKQFAEEERELRGEIEKVKNEADSKRDAAVAEKKNAEDALKQFREQKRKEINTQQEKLKADADKVDLKIKTHLEDFTKKYPRDFTARLKILSDLRKDDDTLNIIAWAICILLIFIETLPVTIKALNGYGNYDLQCYQDKRNKELDVQANIENNRKARLAEVSIDFSEIKNAFNEKINESVSTWKTEFDGRTFVEDLKIQFTHVWDAINKAKQKSESEKETNKYHPNKIMTIIVVQCLAVMCVTLYFCLNQPWFEEIRNISEAFKWSTSFGGASFAILYAFDTLSHRHRQEANKTK